MACEPGPPGASHPLQTSYRPIDGRCMGAQSWANIYTTEVTSNECLSKVQSLLKCRVNMNVARNLQGNDAQAFIDFLDQVSKLHVPRFDFSPRRQTQVLEGSQSCLDGKLRQRSLRLISRICKARGILPASYILQQECIRVGRVHYHGGFADVSKGEYLGCSVAVKCLKMNEGDSDRIFKVCWAKFLCQYRCPTSTF